MAGSNSDFGSYVTQLRSSVHYLSCHVRFVHSTCVRLLERWKRAKPDLSRKLDVEIGLGFKLSLGELPPLPRRLRAYYTEPVYGALLVAGLGTTLLSVVRGIASLQALSESSAVAAALQLTWCFAAVAAACLLHLVFGFSGEIGRSQATCFPIPDEVRALLLDARPPEQLARNVAGPDGTSYCVRCLVWRPAAVVAHHCSACNRCVVGFDHHCSTFGRCIVKGNMPCFITLYAMLCAGFMTMVFCFAMYAIAPEAPGLVIRTMDVTPFE